MSQKRGLDATKDASDLSDMVQPIFASPEQMNIINEVKVLDARFGADKTLFHSISAIAAAKALIEKAGAAGLEQRAFHPLQIWISMHDNEQGMPQRLRSWQPKP